MKKNIACITILMVFCITAVSLGEDTDQNLRAMWNTMTSYLKQGNTEKALKLIHPMTRNKYAIMFQAIKNELPQIMSTQIDFQLVRISDDTAEYTLKTKENGKLYAYEVEFEKWQDGKWYIKEY
ncbi:MAG: hypothetical protein CVU62_12895 [Deltaproteobacteria bacterium HGW-Deltaproteobacteria-2]|jgi:hypothetical protein|nr:MAG: hypothetical protein CVU62_12895 [Deltaproteobacteria bacterium HGW-Deltaproteobacteria-2]